MIFDRVFWRSLSYYLFRVAAHKKKSLTAVLSLSVFHK